MDTYDLFKKLSAGTKLNLQRFKNDAERFSVSYVLFQLYII